MLAIKKRKVEDKILQRRKEIALKMLKEKISLGLAAKLAGISYFEMLDEAIKHGIKPFEVKGHIYKK